MGKIGLSFRRQWEQEAWPKSGHMLRSSSCQWARVTSKLWSWNLPKGFSHFAMSKNQMWPKTAKRCRLQLPPFRTFARNVWYLWRTTVPRNQKWKKLKAIGVKSRIKISTRKAHRKITVQNCLWVKRNKTKMFSSITLTCSIWAIARLLKWDSSCSLSLQWFGCLTDLYFFSNFPTSQSYNFNKKHSHFFKNSNQMNSV